MSELIATRITWVGLVVMLLGLFAINEIAYRVALRRPEHQRDARKSQIDVVIAALLALLGLLLAFSFDIGQERFTRRRDLILDEANAIATTYLRAEMLPAPHGERIEALLREYVDERTNIKSPADLERALRQSSHIHAQLWREASEVGRANLGSPVVALFIQSLNEVIDLHQSRVTVGLFQRLPPVIIETLYLVALLSVALVGMRSGMDRMRGHAPTVVLIIVIMVVLALIDSLDAPDSRLFGIDKGALEDTKALLHQKPASAASAMQ